MGLWPTESVRTRKELPDDLAMDFYLLVEWGLSNFGPKNNTSPANLCQTKRGKKIILDCFHDWLERAIPLISLPHFAAFSSSANLSSVSLNGRSFSLSWSNFLLRTFDGVLIFVLQEVILLNQAVVYLRS